VKTAHPTRAWPTTPTGEPLLVVKDLAVSYGGIKALKGISLEVRRGEVVAMIGANGAGKTTTLKTIVRLLPIATGKVTYDGKDLGSVPAEEVVGRGISLVPEGRAIFPNLTVKENLELGAWNHKDRATMAETVDDVVKLFPRLGERMQQEGGTLSGGEQQMLAIGRAMMARPAMLLLDEPSLGIAPQKCPAPGGNDDFARGAEHASGARIHDARVRVANWGDCDERFLEGSCGERGSARGLSWWLNHVRLSNTSRRFAHSPLGETRACIARAERQTSSLIHARVGLADSRATYHARTTIDSSLEGLLTANRPLEDRCRRSRPSLRSLQLCSCLFSRHVPRLRIFVTAISGTRFPTPYRLR
jgi:branched-chain amino acid transport system ATP-binding protein